MQQAIAALKQRVPLGSTDMVGSLIAAEAVCREPGDGSQERSVVYLGDGMSVAGLVGSERLQGLVDSLVKSRVSVSSYAIGPRIDAELLGALANHTGGMLAIDFAEMTGRQAGAYLAEAARGSVVWPTQVALPQAVHAIYPRKMPPLRFDRDTIVLGKLAADSLASPVEIELQAESAGKRQTMRWSVKPEQPLEDHAYLAKLVDKAAVDGGVKLPTVGSAGLKELRRIASIEAHGYSRLGQQALATGELDAAEQLARVASQLDPMNTEAATIQRAVASAAARSPPRASRCSSPTVKRLVRRRRGRRRRRSGRSGRKARTHLR